MKEFKEKAYIVIEKKSGKPKVDLMGTNENPYLSIHPYTKRGLKQAEGNFNGHEEVTECVITYKKPEPHKCDCKYCVF